MSGTRRPRGLGLAMLLAAAMLVSGGVQAEKPAWAGGGNGEQHGKREKGREAHDAPRKHESRESGGPEAGVTIRFGEQRRTVIREYFSRQVSAGNCPPGLAKKGNGCMPPGQAKKWAVGRPLPRDVVYYDLPPQLVVEVGLPPAGYKYVRVAGDILMIAVGTSMVVDAIEDLGRM